MPFTTSQKAALVAAGLGVAAVATYCVPQLRRLALVVWEGDREALRDAKTLRALKEVQNHRLASKSKAVASGSFAGKKKPGEVDCGYYFFTSDGKKVKTKWDSMDYDKLLAEVDSDDEQSRPEPVQTASTDPSPPRPASQEARQAAAQGLLGEIKYEENNLEKLLSVLDQIRGGSKVKAERKRMIAEIQATLQRLDKVRDEAQSVVQGGTGQQ